MPKFQNSILSSLDDDDDNYHYSKVGYPTCVSSLLSENHLNLVSNQQFSLITCKTAF